MTKFINTRRVSAASPRKRGHAGKTKINVMTINTGIIAVILIFTVGYLVQVNSLATKGYHISELEEKVAEIKQQNRQLEVQVLELQSMDTVRQRVTALDMVPVGTSDYLDSAASFVAANR